MSAGYFSKFGFYDSQGLEGPQGPPGIGFTLDGNGNYDIQNKELVDVNDIEFSSESTLSASEILALDANKKLTALPYSSGWTNNAIVQRDSQGDIGVNNLNATSVTIGAVAGIKINTSASSAHTYTLPDANANANFLLSEGAMNPNGNWQFAGIIASNLTADSIAVGTGAIWTAGGASVTKKLYVGSDIHATTGIYLPTSGGTAALLNYNEEWSGDISFSGIWTPLSPSLSCYIVRVGKTCTLTIPESTASATTSAAISASLPASRFYPKITTNFSVWIVSAGADSVGNLTIDTSGGITFHTSFQGNFSASGNGGIRACSVTYEAA